MPKVAKRRKGCGERTPLAIENLRRWKFPAGCKHRQAGLVLENCGGKGYDEQGTLAGGSKTHGLFHRRALPWRGTVWSWQA